MFKNFRNWLANNRHFLFSRYTKDSQETQEPERTLIQLPSDIRQKLVERIENLPINPHDSQAIAEKLDEVFDLWRDNPDSNNSLVILSSPVTGVSRILTETLEDWAKQKQITIRLLPLKARPEIADTIESKLKHYLEEEFVREAAGDREGDGSPNPSPEIVVLPNLSWCFLRSFEGLTGIEYLQSRLCDGFPNRFWIVGAGQVGWEYLNSVTQLEAYCKDVLTLPELTTEQLRSWFEPIIDELNITFNDPEIDRQILQNDKDNQTHYFETLSDVSNGVSTVAIQAFLKSIHYEEANPELEADSAIIAKVPQLPDLPDLESADLYILYSLLLHGDLTISALAESLGDDRAEVQARVQGLRHQGVIEQRKKVIKINPIHYPNVKRELANNNFVIDKD